MVRHVAFSPDGTKVATGTTDGSATVWAVATGQRLLRLTGHVRDVEWIEFSGDGRLIATAGMDGTARIWNAENGDKVSGIGPIQNAVKSVRFNTDGTQIVAGCGDNVTRLWTVGGTLLREFHGHTDIVNSATLSPDGKRILTASDDGTARVWDAQSGEVILILTQPDPVHTAEFSGDGALIVTSAGFNPVVTATIPPDGNIVRIWDAATGQLVDELRAHATLVSAATFGHDGSILTTSWDNVASLFRPAATAGIAQLLEEGHRRIARFSTAPPPPHPLPASPPRAARP
jgi:WD40 repeat protein